MDFKPMCYLDVERYFYDKEWNTMSELEQNRSRNLLGNYSALVTFGFKPEKPDFVQRYERRLQEQEMRRRKKIAKEIEIAKRAAALSKRQSRNTVSTKNEICNEGTSVVKQKRKNKNEKNRIKTAAINGIGEDINLNENASTNASMKNNVKISSFKSDTPSTSEVSNLPDKTKNNNTKKYFVLKKKPDTDSFSNDVDIVSLTNLMKITEKPNCSEMDLKFDDNSVVMSFILMSFSFTSNKYLDKSSLENKSPNSVAQINHTTLSSTETNSENDIDNNSISSTEKKISTEQKATTNENSKKTYLASKKELTSEEKSEKDDCFKTPLPVVKRYPRRNIPKINYAEPEDIELDHHLFCDDCDRSWVGDCHIHGPLTIAKDSEIPPNTQRSSRALKTVPDGLHVDRSMILAGGYGVWTTKVIPKRTRFGPYKGKILFETPENTRYCWQIKKDGKDFCLIDGCSFAHSNWMRYVNCSRFKDELNVFAYQYKGEIYYRTFKDIAPHTELLVWYGKDYGKTLGITTELFNKPDMSKIKSISFLCTECNVSFTSPLYYNRHIRRSHGRQTTVPMADYINGMMKGKLSPPNAINCNNSPTRLERRFKCQYCKKAFNRTHDLNKHIRIHTNERPYKCQYCNLAFNQSSNLNRHIRIHTNERPYKCQYCNLAFIESSSLNRHIRIHTNERPYKCQYCNLAFIQSSILNRHIRIHTNERPYKCQYCNLAFNQSGHLHNHIRIHTNERPYKCQYCKKSIQ